MSENADLQETEQPVVEVEATPAPEVVEAAPQGEAQEPAEGAEAELDAEAAAEPEPKKRKDWREARLNEEYARRKAAEEERDRLAERARELEARLNGDEYTAPTAANGEPLTAEQIRAEAAKLVEQQNLTAAANRVFDEGIKAHPDFEQVRAQLVGAFGEQLQQRPDFVEAIVSLPNGHDVFHALGSDLNHAAEVIAMSPARMGIELAKLSTELAAPKSRPVSAAPAPIRPVAGSARGGPDIYDPNIPDEEYYAIREKQRQAAFEARRH